MASGRTMVCVDGNRIFVRTEPGTQQNGAGRNDFMKNKIPKRILIVGGGFAGLTVAMELERKLARDPSVEITLINRENFFLFTPMLHEVAVSDLDLTTIVNPVRKMLRRVNFLAGEVDQIDLEQKRVVVSHGFDNHPHTPEFDFLVLGLGSITNTYGLPGCKNMRSP